MRERDHAIQRILVPTDFSANADAALRWAIWIAKPHDAAITLLHVANVVSLASLPLELQTQMATRLERLEHEVGDAGLSVTSVSDAGKPWQRIASEAEKCDVVVIGARGQTPHALHVLGLGSTADRVLRSAPVPVLTVHTDDTVPDQLPRKVIVPTDFSGTAASAPEAVVRLLRPMATEALELILLHAWQPLVEYGDLYGAVPPPNPYVGTEAQALEMLEGLADQMQDETLTIRPVLRQGYPAKIIEAEADAADADLIAMGTHGHAGLARFMLGSVAERVIHRVGCPVLTVGLATRERGETASSAAATAS